MRAAPAGLALAMILPWTPAAADEARPFAEVREAARGQTVYFNAWGGSTPINDHIRWIGDEVEDRFGVELVHVKLTDTAEAVSRVLTEKEAGKEEGGSIDLVWINGENFKSMKENDLLFGPFAFDLPNFELVDTEGKPTTLVDFTVPTEGYESPWGMAQFVMIHDSAWVADPPRSLEALLEWAEANPGRFTYPAPPDFVGTTFLKHILVHRAPEEVDLAAPPPEETGAVVDPVMAYLDALAPHLWRGGERYPRSHQQQHQLFEDGAVAFSMAFNPAEASSLVIEGRMPETTRSYVFEEGSIGNTHFVAIPFNANAKEGAMVVANFLLSPEAQAEKQKPEVWGDFTVLDLDALPPEDRALFDAIELHPATPRPEELDRVLPEPHPDWVEVIEQAWLERYGR